jgi:hypothetical protein
MRVQTCCALVNVPPCSVCNRTHSPALQRFDPHVCPNASTSPQISLALPRWVSACLRRTDPVLTLSDADAAVPVVAVPVAGLRVVATLHRRADPDQRHLPLATHSDPAL